MKIEKYLSASPIFAISVAHERIISDVNRRLGKEEVNILQGLILVALVFEESPEVTPSMLAKEFQTSRANISHAISHLEYLGLVKRGVSASDARKLHISIKPEGKKKALRLIKFYDRLQDLFEESTGAQQCRKTVEGLRGFLSAYSTKREPFL